MRLREIGHERPPLEWKDACVHLSRSSVARWGRVGITVPFAMSAEPAQTFAENLVGTRCPYQSPASVCDECKMSPNGTVILACPPPQAVFKRRKSGRQSSRSAHQTRAAQQIPPLWSTRTWREWAPPRSRNWTRDLCTAIIGGAGVASVFCGKTAALAAGEGRLCSNAAWHGSRVPVDGWEAHGGGGR